MILRLLNWQGIAGIAVAFTLLVTLAVQKFEAVHWRKRSESFELLYQQEKAALSISVANTRTAAEQARAADRANAVRVATEQGAVTERITNDFEIRLAAARADARGLRIRSSPATDPSAGASTSMSAIPVAAGVADGTAGQDRLRQSDAMIATEQAIQLDELIRWVREQAKVDNSPRPDASPPDEAAQGRK